MIPIVGGEGDDTDWGPAELITTVTFDRLESPYCEPGDARHDVQMLAEDQWTELNWRDEQKELHRMHVVGCDRD